VVIHRVPSLHTIMYSAIYNAPDGTGWFIDRHTHTQVIGRVVIAHVIRHGIGSEYCSQTWNNHGRRKECLSRVLHFSREQLVSHTIPIPPTLSMNVPPDHLCSPCTPPPSPYHSPTDLRLHKKTNNNNNNNNTH